MKAATIINIPALDENDISIHAAREGGDPYVHACIRANQISIHAAREGGDSSHLVCLLRIHISIHAAREGGDMKAANSLP